MSRQINDSTLILIRNSRICKAKLQIALDKSAPTIQRYLDDNDIMLTTRASLDVIQGEFGLTETQILTDNSLEMELRESDVNNSKN